MATVRSAAARRGATAGLLAGAALLAGCGDGIVDRGFRGVAFWSYDIGTEAGAQLPENPAPVRASLFFAPGGVDQLDPEQMIELSGSTTTVETGAPLRMDIFELPSREMFARSPSGQVLDYAVARMLAYEDITFDGHRQKGEYFVGINAPYAFLYTPTALPAEKSPTARALPAGFTALLLPQSCGQKPAPATDPDTCGVSLGSGCRTAQDCGTGGSCLRETQLGWPAGYCTITEPVASGGCRPGKSEILYRPEYSPVPAEIDAYYLRRCTSEEDCDRPEDRDRDLYSCDVGLGACVPRRGSTISLFGPVEIASICAKPR